MPKISKLKGGYVANAVLFFNSWPNDINICVQEHKLPNLVAVQLVKDYTSDTVRGVIEFYLETNFTWNYHKLIEHLRMSFKMGETLSSVVGNFYSQTEHHKETEDQVIDQLQFFSRKVLSIHPEWKPEVNEALKLNSPSNFMIHIDQPWHVIF